MPVNAQLCYTINSIEVVIKAAVKFSRTLLRLYHLRKACKHKLTLGKFKPYQSCGSKLMLLAAITFTFQMFHAPVLIGFVVKTYIYWILAVYCVK